MKSEDAGKALGLVLFVIFVVIAVAALLGFHNPSSISQSFSPEISNSNTQDSTATSKSIQDSSKKSADPSERALKAAANVLVYVDEKTREELIKDYSSTGNGTEAVRNLAVSFDEQPEKLTLAEAAALAIQQNHSNRTYISCSSNLVGSSVYTNCY